TGTDQGPKVLPFSTRLLPAPDSRRSEAGPSGQNALDPAPKAFLMERNTGFEPATFALARRCLTPHTRSVSLLIHAMTAARSAACSGMPSALARLSRCFQTLAGKRTERGMVGPVSVPFLGLPRPEWME